MLFDRLSGREKVLLIATGGALATFLVILVSIWINFALRGLEDRLETKRGNYQQILSLQQRYEDAKQNISSVQGEIQGNRNTLTKDIGELATENGIEISRIIQAKGAVDKKAKAREESVKVELRKVALPPLLNFLQGLEKRNALFFIRSLDMRRRFDDHSLVDASFKISTLVPLEEEG